MRFYHIVAVATGGVIGKDNRLPWHFSSDLKHFKELTMGSTLLMGRKTFESIGKPLPGRENFVLSRKYPFPLPLGGEGGGEGESPARFFHSLEDALKAIKTEKAFIIGGETLYRETINQVDGIYLTSIHEKYEGDAFYPAVPSFFKEKERKILQENPKIEFIYLENQGTAAL